MDIQVAISQVVEGRSLTTDDMATVMRQIMTGAAQDAQIGGLLVALRMKGEAVSEIAGAAKVMRELATGVKVEGEHLVDIVGTGGDGSCIFNVSTASSMVVAAAGGKVAKHGNRSVSSSSGAADLLEAAGVRIDLNSEEVARCVDELGVGFMFAVNHHSAAKYAAGPRKALGIRTLFNVLGPITNPAGVKRQLLGVYSAELQRPIAEVLRELGSDHVLVVHANDGLDEISIAAETRVVELHRGEIKEYSVTPEQFGMERSALDSLVVDNAKESLAVIKLALTGGHPVAANMLALNAGAALYAADVSSNLGEGVALAQDVIASGLGWEKLRMLAQFTQLLKEV
ncbi:MAG: anthranilate phosphoribosyltransferase [Halieaceae bacterium]|jgi:anthranilate phosphoribosyltransferase